MASPANLSSAGKTVWSILDIQREIISYLPKRDVFTLLLVDKSSFHAAVKILYETIEYRAHQKRIKVCRNQERKEVYLSAVRVVSIHDVGKQLPFAKWPTYLKPFPHAVKVHHANAALLRVDNGQDALFELHIDREVDATPDYISPIPSFSGVPKAWTKRHVVHLWIEDPASFHLGSVEDRRKGLQATLKELFDKPDVVVTSLEIGSPDLNRTILQFMQKRKAEGLATLKDLTTFDHDDDSFSLINQLAENLVSLSMFASSDRDEDSLTLDKFMRRFETKRLLGLSSLTVELQLDTHTLLHNTPSEQEFEFNVELCSRNLHGLKFCEITIFVSHNISSSPRLLNTQKFLLRSFARHLHPLLDSSVLVTPNPLVLNVDAPWIDQTHTCTARLDALREAFLDELRLLFAID